MSQASIQKKLWKAYGKVANKLGVSFNVYRSSVLDNPIQDMHWVNSQSVSFSKDDKYKKSGDDKLSLWTCWIDGNMDLLFDIQQGDMLYNEELNDTYYIANAESLLPIKAVRANDRISVLGSATYADTGTGFSPQETETASEVPCYIMQPSSRGGAAGYIDPSTWSSDAIPNYTIYLWDPQNTIQLRDNIVDQFGNRSQVLTIDRSDAGTKLLTQGTT